VRERKLNFQYFSLFLKFRRGERRNMKVGGEGRRWSRGKFDVVFAVVRNYGTLNQISEGGRRFFRCPPQRKHKKNSVEEKNRTIIMLIN
jgi:hypothetical protein